MYLLYAFMQVNILVSLKNKMPEMVLLYKSQKKNAANKRGFTVFCPYPLSKPQF